VPVYVCINIYMITTQAYDELRKIAGYPSLSDKGGNTDVVTRKVWATLLSMIHSLRPMDQAKTEGIMLTDGHEPNRAVVEEVPLLRQAAARRETELTMTGNPAPHKRSRQRRRTNKAPTTPPATPADRPRGGSKRPRAVAASHEQQFRRPKTHRSRRSGTAASSSAAPSQETADDEDSDDQRREDGDEEEGEEEYRLTAPAAAAAAAAAAAEVDSCSVAAARAAAAAGELDTPPVSNLMAELLEGGDAE